jgi:hypothetical protein
MLTMPVQQQHDDDGSGFEAFEEAARWIAEAFSVAGWGISIIAHGVTNVKEWENNTDQELEVWKVDGRGRENNYRITPGQTLRGDMWVPWADTPEQYTKHHGTVKVGGELVGCFWQSGNALWCSTRDEFMGIQIPGVQGAGGNRRMVFGTNPQGRTAFVVGTY